MDGNEGMSMAKMAVAVLLVVLLIGAVVGLVYAAYSWFNSGSDKLANTVTALDKSALSEYDSKQVSGTKVLTAMKQYRESDVAILVANKSTQGGSFDMSATTLTNVNNYCALAGLAAKANSGQTSTGDVYNLASLGKDSDGKWSFAGFQTQQGGISTTKNTNFSPTSLPSSAATYVKPSATWFAELVYDSNTNEVGGILFRQMN